MPKIGLKKSGKRNLLDVKWLILSGSLAATLGFWGVFSKADSLGAYTAAGTDANGNPDVSKPVEVANRNTVTLSLPPMPTLIPMSGDSASLLSAQSPLTASLSSAAPATAQKPTKIFLGGSKPGSRSAAPLTRTSSSR
jgi:hypothetical protein